RRDPDRLHPPRWARDDRTRGVFLAVFGAAGLPVLLPAAASTAVLRTAASGCSDRAEQEKAREGQLGVRGRLGNEPRFRDLQQPQNDRVTLLADWSTRKMDHDGAFQD